MEKLVGCFKVTRITYKMLLMTQESKMYLSCGLQICHKLVKVGGVNVCGIPLSVRCYTRHLVMLIASLILLNSCEDKYYHYKLSD